MKLTKSKMKTEEDFEEDDKQFLRDAHKRRLESALNEDKYNHAVKAIINSFKIRTDKNTEDLSVSYYSFIFENNDEGITDLRNFLEKMKKVKCFYDFHFENDSPFGPKIVFEDINIGNLKEVRDNGIFKKETQLELITVPVGCNWMDITIKLEDNHDVIVYIKGKKVKTDYRKLGFCDSRSQKQDKIKVKDSWKLLNILAANSGILDLGKLSDSEKRTRKKQKQELAGLLKKIFMIEDEPIEFIREQGKYKARFKLIPTEDFREDFEDRKISDPVEKDNKFDDWGEVYKSQTT